MTPEQFQEGLAYAENAFRGERSHLTLDKALFSKHFDFNGKKILDFGCGMGGMTLWYAQQWDCTVTGSDIDPNHIAIAQKLWDKFPNPRVSFHLQNVLETPLTEKFDYIILNDVAEHIQIDILEAIFAELKKSLAPGGKIFVSYPPWEGPYASHLNHVLGIPWCQFLPDSYLRKLMKDKDRQLVGTKTILAEYDELNHLNHDLLMKTARQVGLKMTYRKSHSKLNKIINSDASFTFGPLKYLVTKELVLLEA